MVFRESRKPREIGRLADDNETLRRSDRHRDHVGRQALPVLNPRVEGLANDIDQASPYPCVWFRRSRAASLAGRASIDRTEWGSGALRLKSLAAIVAALASVPGMARDGNVLIRHARVFDGVRMLALRDVLVQHGRIVAVDRHVAAPSGIETVDAKRRVLQPGLIDGHVHVFPGAQRDALRFGVTSVFDMYSLADRPTIER